MIRLLLTCLGVAALQLGGPSAVDAADLVRPSGQTQSVEPRVEVQSKGALLRDSSRTEADALSLSTSSAPASAPRLPDASAFLASPTEAPRRTAPASLPRVLPDVRAPPA